MTPRVITSTAKDRVSVKKHDEGLTKSEKIFVHALRDLFDPKGKNKVVSMEPKGYVPRHQSNSESSGTKRQKDRLTPRQRDQKKEKSDQKPFLRRDGHLPPITMLKWKHPYQQRQKANAKRLEQDLAEKRKTSEKKSRSQLRRAVKREKLQITYAAKHLGKAGTATAARRIMGNLNDFQKAASAVPQRGIEVVQAFGGEQCLRMLGSISYRKEYMFVSWTVTSKDSFGDEGGNPMQTRRDYAAKFTKGLNNKNFEKNRLVHPVPKQKRTSEKKESTVQPKAERSKREKAKGKADDKAKSAGRKEGASALRRKLQRRERALEIEKKKSAAQAPLTPAISVARSVSEGKPAKEELRDALNVLSEKEDAYFKRMKLVVTTPQVFEAWLGGTSDTSLRHFVSEYTKHLKSLQVRIRWVMQGTGMEPGQPPAKILAMLKDIFGQG